jgi:hypothetical protein
MPEDLEVWLGLVELEARQECDLFDTGSGAMANAVSLAESASDHARRVSAFFEHA